MHYASLSKRIFPTLVLCLLTLRPQAHGFENYEHSFVGDLSLKLARSYFEKSHARDISEQEMKRVLNCIDSLLSNAQTLPKSKRLLTYGLLCEMPDHQFTPVHSFINFAHAGGESSLNTEEIEERLNNWITSFHLLGNNGDHFQTEAMGSYKYYHGTAFALAKSDLKAALVINAFADHFLQDLHAPGHILADHNVELDGTVLAIHDSFNKHGYRVGFDTNKIKIKQSHPDEASIQLQRIIQHIESNCHSEKIQKSAKQLQSIAKFNESPSESNKAILFFGDANLIKSYDQIAYLLSQNILSIYRILHTSAIGPQPLPSNYFEYLSREQVLAYLKSKDIPADKQVSGEQCETAPPSACTKELYKIGPIYYNTEYEDLDSLYSFSIHTGRIFSRKDMKHNSESETVLSLIVGSIWDKLPESDFAKFIKGILYPGGGICLGTDETYDEVKSVGGEWRYAIIAKELNLGFCATLSPRFYDQGDTWRWDYGFGVYTGFSILMFESAMRYHNFHNGHSIDADWGPYIGVSFHNVPGIFARLSHLLRRDKGKDELQSLRKSEFLPGTDSANSRVQ